MRKKTSGFTLIEMLVGIVIGMIVVAAASVMMVTVLKSQKDVTASARLNQELGAAMAVMSNEIRRAGFRICDVSADNDMEFECPDDDGDTYEDPFIPVVLLGEDLKIDDVDGSDPPDEGNCVLYRYNADVNDALDPGEQRGFRKNGDTIEMADTSGVVTCGDNPNWVPLTDPAVIKITDLSFSSTGSKCRNMDGDDLTWYGKYWTVGKLEDGAVVDNTPPETKQACELEDGTAVVVYNSSGVPANGNFQDSWLGDGTVFNIRQVFIKLEAELVRDSAVSKILTTSVKVANPHVVVP